MVVDLDNNDDEAYNENDKFARNMHRNCRDTKFFMCTYGTKSRKLGSIKLQDEKTKFL